MPLAGLSQDDLIGVARGLATQNHKPSHVLQHLIPTVENAYRHFGSRADIVISAWLHDFFECAVTIEVGLPLVHQLFGSSIGGVVEALTDERPGTPSPEAVERLKREGEAAVAVALCEFLAEFDQAFSKCDAKRFTRVKERYAPFRDAFASGKTPFTAEAWTRADNVAAKSVADMKHLHDVVSQAVSEGKQNQSN